MFEKIKLLDKPIEDFEIVIARYNEDLSWIKKEFKYEKITIYNKGKDDLILPEGPKYKIINLPNIGRESHTYLYHIVSNYSNLAERTLFLQGDPYDDMQTQFQFFPFTRYKTIAEVKCKNIIAAHCFKNSDFTTSVPDRLISKDQMLKFSHYGFHKFRERYMPRKKLSDIFFYMIYGANFAVDKDKILRHNKDYYNQILGSLDSISPVEGLYMECLWDVLFD